MVCPGLVEINRPCGKPLINVRNTNFDHIMRNEICPDNSVENCRPLCLECHAIKTARDALEAAKGRHIRGETRVRRKVKIRSAGFPDRQQRRALRERYAKRD